MSTYDDLAHRGLASDPAGPHAPAGIPGKVIRLVEKELALIAECPTNTGWSRLHHARLDLAKMAAKEDKRRRKARGTEDVDVPLPPVTPPSGSRYRVDPDTTDETGGAA